MAELRPADSRYCDKLGEQLNAKAGTEYLIQSKTLGRAVQVQKTIDSL